MRDLIRRRLYEIFSFSLSPLYDSAATGISGSSHHRRAVPSADLHQTAAASLPFVGLHQTTAAQLPSAGLYPTTAALLPSAGLHSTTAPSLPYAVLDQTTAVPLPSACLHQTTASLLRGGAGGELLQAAPLLPRFLPVPRLHPQTSGPLKQQASSEARRQAGRWQFSGVDLHFALAGGSSSTHPRASAVSIGVS